MATNPVPTPFPSGYPNLGVLQEGDVMMVYRSSLIPPNQQGGATFSAYSTAPIMAGVVLIAGQPLRMISSGTVGLASSLTLAAATCVGVCGSPVAVGVTVPLAVSTVTIAGLTVGSIYYLSATPGVLSIIPPITGQYSTKVGIAVTPTTLLINIGYPELVP